MPYQPSDLSFDKTRTPQGAFSENRHETVPFNTVEEAWFWFIQAHQARLDGARVRDGQGMFRRPCEPVDIFRIMDRLYRSRRLSIDHFRILRHYGLRLMPPEKWRAREARAATLWAEAMRTLEPILIAKKILRDPLHVAMNGDARAVIPIWAHRDAPRHSYMRGA